MKRSSCRLCGTVSVSWHQHYRRQCVLIIMVLVMILFIYVHSWDMKASAHGYASRNTGPLRGESTDQRRIPCAKDSHVKFWWLNHCSSEQAGSFETPWRPCGATVMFLVAHYMASHGCRAISLTIQAALLIRAMESISWCVKYVLICLLDIFSGYN